MWKGVGCRFSLKNLLASLYLTIVSFAHVMGMNIIISRNPTVGPMDHCQSDI